MRFDFDAEVWRSEEPPVSWFFLSLPEDVSADVREVPLMRRGFGSVRVEVTIGGTTWRTSIFPDAGRATYVLPLKAAVRDAEAIGERDVVEVGLVVLDA